MFFFSAEGGEGKAPPVHENRGGGMGGPMRGRGGRGRGFGGRGAAGLVVFIRFIYVHILDALSRTKHLHYC